MMRKRNLLIVVVLLALAALFWPRAATQQAPVPQPPGATSLPATSPSRPQQARDSLPAFLPREARGTVAAIRSGGPFGHRQDGAVFGNREGRLPRRRRGFYREYTVATPGVQHRGARRIVTGGNPPSAWYYTDDHYESFRAFDVDDGGRGMEGR